MQNLRRRTLLIFNLTALGLILTLSVSLPLSANAADGNGPGVSRWSSETLSGPERLAKICSGEPQYDVGENDFSEAIEFRNRGAVVDLCYRERPKRGYFKMSYILKYSLAPKAPVAFVTYEAEMMTWGLDYKTAGSVLTFYRYWPSDVKARRRVSQVSIDCTGVCQLTEKCEIERLKSDWPKLKLLAFIKEKSKSSKSSRAFVLDGGTQDSLRLDQLFIESLTGDKAATALLDGLAKGTDAGSSEIAESLREYRSQFESKKCTWQK